MHRLQTRYLLPFFHDFSTCDELAQVLLELRFATAKGEKPVWQRAQVADLYRNEVLPEVTAFLFGQGADEPRYYRVNPELSSHWFGQGVEIHYGRERVRRVALESHAAIELFILPAGVGLLSIALRYEQGELDTDALKIVNYRLAQWLPAKIANLVIPHSGHPNAKPPPAANAPLNERLGRAGGAFNLPELCGFLLGPLKLGERGRPQPQFSIYSALRIQPPQRFIDPATQVQWRPLLSALTHLEEENHPGSLRLNENVLNAHHWAAVGTLGSAHLLTDQPGELGFNEQRQTLCFIKYFIPYLVAKVQRLILLRTLQRGAEILATVTDQREQALRFQSLHGDILRFSLHGHFAEVSSREVLNQYYQLSRTGLRVEKTFETLRRALHDADMKSESEHQSKTLREMHTMQSKLEWLEVFFASYYAGALAYYVSSGLFSKLYTSLSSAGWAFFAGALVLYGIRPWSHKPSGVSWARILIPIGLGMMVWFGIGWVFFR